MVEFSYRVLDRDGEVQTGILDAPDLAAATSELYRAGFTPLDVSADGATFLMRLNQPVTFFEEPSARDIQIFLRDLGRLLRSGLSLDDALKLLHDMTEREMFKRAIERIREKVRQGESLATALALQKKYFDVQTTAAVQAGELSGTLSEALETVAASMHQALSFRERVRSALIYPSILMLMVAATFVLVMTFVLPQFAPLFNGNEDKLPWATRFVMSLGDLFVAQWYVLLAALLAALFWTLSVARSERARARFYKAACGVPLLKTWLLTPDIVRFVRTLGVCTRSGIALDKALAMAIDAVKMPHIAEALTSVRAEVRRGGHLSGAFLKVDWLPVLVLQFTRVGEQSGRLGQMLDEAAVIVAQDYETRLEKALEVLSPVLTLVMGGVVALLVGSVLLGIMSINDVAL